MVKFETPTYNTFRDMNYCLVWQTDRQTDRQKATHMSPPCNMHRWAQKGTSEQRNRGPWGINSCNALVSKHLNCNFCKIIGSKIYSQKSQLSSRAWEINRLNNTNQINRKSIDLCKLGGQSLRINQDQDQSHINHKN